jgi:hypothetical protein
VFLVIGYKIMNRLLHVGFLELRYHIFKMEDINQEDNDEDEEKNRDVGHERLLSSGF